MKLAQLLSDYATESFVRARPDSSPDSRYGYPPQSVDPMDSGALAGVAERQFFVQPRELQTRLGSPMLRPFLAQELTRLQLGLVESVAPSLNGLIIPPVEYSSFFHSLSCIAKNYSGCRGNSSPTPFDELKGNAGCVVFQRSEPPML